METPDLDRAGLRSFGFTSSLIIILLFGAIIPYLLSREIPTWPWVAGAILGIWAIVAPEWLNPVYRTWMKFGHLMNLINTNIILGILFYGIILPVGLLMKLLGKDPMHRKFDHKISSYRINSQKEERDNVKRPY